MNIKKCLTFGALTTLAHPQLWVLGLFLVGGLHAQGLITTRHSGISGGVKDLGEVIHWITIEPGHAFQILSISILALIVVYVITIFSRALVLIAGVALLAHKQNSAVRVFSKKSIKEAWRLTPRLIIISLSTVSMVMLAAIILAVPVVMWAKQSGFQVYQALFAGGLFLLIVFFLSCINILAICFCVVFKQSAVKSLALAADLFFTHWRQLLKFVPVLASVYGVSFLLSNGLVNSFKVISDGVLALAGPLSPYLLVYVLQGLLVSLTVVNIVWLAGLNVFYNLSFLAVFMELIAPIKAEYEPTLSSAPVAVAE